MLKDWYTAILGCAKTEGDGLGRLSRNIRETVMQRTGRSGKALKWFQTISFAGNARRGDGHRSIQLLGYHSHHVFWMTRHQTLK